jgi:hypothetical protein
MARPKRQKGAMPVIDDARQAKEATIYGTDSHSYPLPPEMVAAHLVSSSPAVEWLNQVHLELSRRVLDRVEVEARREWRMARFPRCRTFCKRDSFSLGVSGSRCRPMQSPSIC